MKIHALLLIGLATVFFGALVALIGLLLDSYTPFKAVSGALMVIMVCTVFRREAFMV